MCCSWPAKVIFLSKSVKNSSKRCPYSTFSSQATRHSKSVNSGFVLQQQIWCNLRVVACVLNTINSIKRIGIFSAEIYLLFKLLCWDPPNPIASCEFKPFWFTNWPQLSTYLWKTCLQRTFQVFLHASRNFRKFVYCLWAIWVNHAAEHLCCVVILNIFPSESRNKSW